MEHEKTPGAHRVEEVRMEVKFTKYIRKGWIEMRPYISGENTRCISISPEDIKHGLDGGMIARNPDNHADQWFVAKDFFEKNYEEA